MSEPSWKKCDDGYEAEYHGYRVWVGELPSGWAWQADGGGPTSMNGSHCGTRESAETACLRNVLYTVSLDATALRAAIDRLGAVAERLEAAVAALPARSTARSTARGIDWDAQPLGVEPDPVIAERLGVSRQSVYMARRARGIPAVNGPSAPRAGIDWDAQPLGVEPDPVIAERLGVHESSVGEARRRRGIPAYRARKKKTVPA